MKYWPEASAWIKQQILPEHEYMYWYNYKILTGKTIHIVYTRNNDDIMNSSFFKRLEGRKWKATEAGVRKLEGYKVKTKSPLAWVGSIAWQWIKKKVKK